MRGLTRLIATGLAACLSTGAMAQTSREDAAGLASREIVETYLENAAALFRETADEQTVDRFFGLFTEDVQYIHARFEADFSRESWEAAIRRNLALERFDSPADFCMRLTNWIAGNPHSAVEYAYGNLDEEGRCRPEDDERKLAVFWFDGDLIRKVEELW